MKSTHFLRAANAIFPLLLCTFTDNTLTKPNQEQTASLDTQSLDGLAIRNANRGDSRESIRRKTPVFVTCERFSRIASNLILAVFLNFSPPEARFAKKGVQCGNPETIRENQAIRGKLRIDSRESGHLRRNLHDHSLNTTLTLGALPVIFNEIFHWKIH